MEKRILKILELVICIFLILNIISKVMVIITILIGLNRINSVNLLNVISLLKDLIILIFSINLIRYITTNGKSDKVHLLKIIAYNASVLGIIDLIYKLKNTSYSLISDGYLYEAPFIYFFLSFICLSYYRKITDDTNR